MATLSARDVLAVLDLVGEAHHATTLEQFRTGLLPAITRLVPCDWISYNEVGADGVVHAVLTEPMPPAHLFPEWERYALQNPILAHYQRTLDGRAYRFSDFLTQDELHALDLYQHVYRHLDVEFQLALSLPSGSDITIGIALSRAREDFSQRDRDVLDLARPHLIQAWRNAQLRPVPRPPGPEALREHLRLLGMSAREADVLAAFMQGASTDVTAEQLGISPRTVHKHTERIRAKLGAGTRAEAVATAWAAVAAAPSG